MTNRGTDDQNRRKTGNADDSNRGKVSDLGRQNRREFKNPESQNWTKTKDAKGQNGIRARDAEVENGREVGSSEEQNGIRARDAEVENGRKARAPERQNGRKASSSEDQNRKKSAAVPADSNVETAPVYLALVHHPVYNKNGNEITTTITNLDLHDISRAGKTYDIAGYYVVNHLKSQQALVRRMRKYWTGGKGAEFNENRHEAFSVLRIADFLEDVTAEISAEQGQKPLMVTTSAKSYAHTSPVSFQKLRCEIENSNRPCLILFGTGWGLSEKLIADCDYLLEPVRGRGDFNHLSVRSAASIILDRLLAPAWWEQNF